MSQESLACKRNNLAKEENASREGETFLHIRGNEIFSLGEKLREARLGEISELAPRIIRGARFTFVLRQKSRFKSGVKKKDLRHTRTNAKRGTEPRGACSPEEFRLIEFALLSSTGPICEFGEAYRATNNPHIEFVQF